jgi:hypothetical protein
LGAPDIHGRDIVLHRTSEKQDLKVRSGSTGSGRVALETFMKAAMKPAERPVLSSERVPDIVKINP